MRRRLPLFLLAGLLSACHTTAVLPTFRLASADGGAVAVAGNVAAAEAGTLTVHFGGLVKAQRRLLATVADVDRVVIALSGNGVSHAQTIPKAQIVDGRTSFTFTGLPAGTLTVTVRALDAAGRTIGSETLTATVTAGQTTVATAVVKLVPAVATPRVIVPNGGSGGGSTGSLTTDVTFLDGAPVITPPIVRSFFGNLEGRDAGQLRVEADGTLWVTASYRKMDSGSGEIYGLYGDLYRIPAGGAPIAASLGSPFRLIATSMGPSRVLGLGNPGASLLRLPAAGTTFLPFTDQFVELIAGADTTPAGVTWLYNSFAGGTTAMRLNADHTATEAGWDITRPDDRRLHYPYGMRADADGKLWFVMHENVAVAPAPTDYVVNLVRIDPVTHAELVSIRLPGETDAMQVDLTRDGQRNMWVASPASGSVTKRNAAGQTLATAYPATRFNRLYVDAQDRVWAYLGAPTLGVYMTPDLPPAQPTDLIARLSPAGAVEAYYHVGAGVQVTEIAVTPDDHLWVGTKDHGLLELDPGL